MYAMFRDFPPARPIISESWPRIDQLDYDDNRDEDAKRPLSIEQVISLALQFLFIYVVGFQ